MPTNPENQPPSDGPLDSLRRIRRYDRLIAEFKRKHSRLAELVD